MYAVDEEFIVQVRGSCPTCSANVTDGLTLLDSFTWSNTFSKRREVQIFGRVLLAVLHDDKAT